MVELGRRLGNYLGGKQPEKILEIEDIPNTNLAKVYWPQNGRTCSNEHIFIDCKRVAVVGLGQTEAIIQLPDSNRHSIEVFAAGTFNADEPEEVLQKYIFNPVGSRVCLRWGLPSATALLDIAGFRVRGGTSLPLDLLGTVGNAVKHFTTEELAPGTYTFKVNPIDFLGNEKTSIFSVVVIVPFPVEPPSLPVTFSLVGTTGTIGWAASPTPGISFYNVYSNGGVVGGFVDFDTPFASVTGAMFTASGPVSAGSWIFVVRAEKAGLEEENFDRRVSVILDDDPPPLRIISGQPNGPSFLAANPEEGGVLKVIVGYDALGETSEGGRIKIFVHKLGTPEPATPTEEIEIPDHEVGENISYTFTKLIGTVSDDTYVITAKVEDEDELESPEILTITQTTDSVPPSGDITSLEGMLV